MESKGQIVIGEHTRIRPRKKYRLIKWGTMPGTDKRGALIEDFWGRTYWKSYRVIVHLRRERRIVDGWEV